MATFTNTRDDALLCKHEILVEFYTFNSFESMQVFEILSNGAQKPIYRVYSLIWLVMTWRHEELRHQQPCFLP